ncbi:Release factor glutamine methyltransferase [Rhodocyclaceae bacterium]|jgi:release factor glutamine methyltransferase|nr:Release factor glutamine methyltransferase [Rhodocyclaceae bacterium]
MEPVWERPPGREAAADRGVDAVPTVARLLDEARASVPLSEARLLLRHVLGVTHAALEAHPEREVSPRETADFHTLAMRRAAGEPIAYLTGHREFYGLEFHVTPAVLIPREETELLVEIAVEKPARRILDLGTGSGCLAIAVARELPRAQVTAVDVSAAALDVARENAARHGATVRFVQGDWFAPLGGERFDLILANPPYVAEADPHLAQGDVRFEPRGALAAGPDGLDDIRRIVAAAAAHLVAGGRLVFEHGYDQAQAVAALLAQAGFVAIEQRRDLAGIPRVTGGARP